MPDSLIEGSQVSADSFYDDDTILMSDSEWLREIISIDMESRRRSVDQICALVNLTSLVLPKKVASEYLGDTLEDVADWTDAGMKAWKIQFLGLTRIFWAVVYTLRDIAPVALSAAVGKFFLG